MKLINKLFERIKKTNASFTKIKKRKLFFFLISCIVSFLVVGTITGCSSIGAYDKFSLTCEKTLKKENADHFVSLISLEENKFNCNDLRYIMGKLYLSEINGNSKSYYKLQNVSLSDAYMCNKEINFFCGLSSNNIFPSGFELLAGEYIKYESTSAAYISQSLADFLLIKENCNTYESLIGHKIHGNLFGNERDLLINGIINRSSYLDRIDVISEYFINISYHNVFYNSQGIYYFACKNNVFDISTFLNSLKNKPLQYHILDYDNGEYKIGNLDSNINSIGGFNESILYVIFFLLWTFNTLYIYLLVKQDHFKKKMFYLCFFLLVVSFCVSIGLTALSAFLFKFYLFGYTITFVSFLFFLILLSLFFIYALNHIIKTNKYEEINI